MKKYQNIFLFISFNNMQIYFIHVSVAVLTYGINNKGIPLLGTFLTFYLASTLYAIQKKKQTPLFLSVITHALAFFSIATYILQSFHNVPFSNKLSDWFYSLYLQPKDGVTTLIFIVVLLIITGIYSLGIMSVKKEKSYKHILGTMEIDTGLLLMTSLISFFLKIPIDKFVIYVLLFFLWAIPSVALSKSKTWGTGNNKGRSHVGLIMVFVFSVAITIIGVLAFMLDSLKLVAKAGSGIIATFMAPIIPYFNSILKYIFGSMMGYRSDSSNAVISNGNDEFSQSAVTVSNTFLDKLEPVLLIALAILAIITLMVIGIYIIKQLIKKRHGENTTFSFRSFFYDGVLAWVQWIKDFYSSIKQSFARENKKDKEAIRVYKKMMHWGMFRGLRCADNETPLAYSQRLSLKYPDLAEEFSLISQNFCEEKYSSGNISVEAELRVKLAYKKMVKLRHLL